MNTSIHMHFYIGYSLNLLDSRMDEFLSLTYLSDNILFLIFCRTTHVYTNDNDNKLRRITVVIPSTPPTMVTELESLDFSNLVVPVQTPLSS